MARLALSGGRGPRPPAVGHQHQQGVAPPGRTRQHRTTADLFAGWTAGTVGSYDGTMRLWDVQTGKELRRYDHAGVIYSVAVSADGRRLSGGEDRMVRLWRLPE